MKSMRMKKRMKRKRKIRRKKKSSIQFAKLMDFSQRKKVLMVRSLN